MLVEQYDETAKIPINKIVVPRNRIRSNVEKNGAFEELKRSMAQVGLINPIEVAPEPETGRYILVAGLRRLLAAEELGWKEIDASIKQRSDLERRLAEIDENLRREDLTSKERSLARAEYARIIAILRRGGRPSALTSEQIEEARHLKKQGKSLREIAGKLNVSHMTVQRNLKKDECAVTKMVHDAPIMLQQKSKSPADSQEGRISGTRGVASTLGLSHSTIVRDLEVERAIKKYPALNDLDSSTAIRRLARFADLRGLSKKQVEGAVNLVLKGVNPIVAAAVQMLDEDERAEMLEIYGEKRYPPEWIAHAAEIVAANRHNRISPRAAVNLVIGETKKFKVELGYPPAVEALEKAAEEKGLTQEAYIALATLNQLRMDGYLKGEFHREAVRLLMEGWRR